MSGGVGVVIKVDKVETGPQVKQTVLGPFIDEVLPQGAVDKDGRFVCVCVCVCVCVPLLDMRYPSSTWLPWLPLQDTAGRLGG